MAVAGCPDDLLTLVVILQIDSVGAQTVFPD
jgi:hypothetical protein